MFFKFNRQSINASWLLGEKVLRLLITFLISVWVANYLGPKLFGVLSYSQSFVYLFSALATLGLDSIVIKKIVKNEASNDKVIRAAFILRFLGSLLSVILLLIVIRFLDHDNSVNNMIYIIMFSVIFNSFNVIDLFFQAKEENKTIVFVNIISLIIISVIKIILIYIKAQILFFAVVLVVETVITSLGYLYCYTQVKKNSFFSMKLNRALSVSLLNESWPLLLTAFFVVIYKKIDQIMIFNLIGESAAGYYGYAVKFIDPTVFIASSLGVAFYPQLVSLSVSNKKGMEQLFRKLYLTVIILFILLYVFSVPLFSYFVSNYFSDYQKSIPIFSIYLISNLSLFIHNISWRYDIIENNRKLLSIKLFIGAIINICLNLWLIKTIGLVGAAWATVISYFFAHVMLNLIFKKTRKNFYLLLTSFMALKKN